MKQNTLDVIVQAIGMNLGAAFRVVTFLWLLKLSGFVDYLLSVQ